MKKGKAALVLLFTTVLAGSALAGCGQTSSNNSAAPGSNASSSGASADNGPKYNFRLADIQPADYPTVIGDKKFADIVNTKTNGRIKIDVFPAGQLGAEKDIIEQVQLGSVEFTRVSTGPMAEFNKDFGVFSLPYIFDNVDHEWRFLQSPEASKLLDGLNSSKLQGLAYYESGSRNFYSRKPLTSIADLKGQKIRVQQNKINVDLISALGASATPMDYGEVFTSLQTGVLDAAENNYPSYFSANHFQVAKNFIADGHQRVPEVVVMSKSAWDKLSDGEKKIIRDAAVESEQTQRDAWAKYEKDSIDKVKASGAVITEVKDVKVWQDAVKPVIDKYGPDYKNVLDAINKYKQ